MSFVLRYGSGEFLLKNHPNSGSVVFLRAAMTTVVIYVVAVVLHGVTKPGAVWPSLSFGELLNSFHATLPWLGAIFAGSYAALYTRFASQWAYLADLYNELMQAQSQRPADEGNADVFASWKAGFIEDAEEVHLHRKAVYASVILSMLETPGVREKYERYTPGGRVRLERVLREVQEVFAREQAKRSRA